MVDKQRQLDQRKSANARGRHNQRHQWQIAPAEVAPRSGY
jgi:hypothetical protein